MLELHVEKMKCGGCASAVEAAVKAVDPLATVQVDLAQKRAKIETTANASTVIERISEAGFPASQAN